MPLTSDDVRAKQFNPSRLVRKGYDEAEVDNFLDEVVAALDERDGTIGTLSERLAAQQRAAGRQDGELAASDPAAAPSGAEAATALLAMAERTASDHVAAGQAAAAEALVHAERAAAETTAAAQAEARRLVAEAEDQRRRLLASLQDERQHLEAETAALQAATERARAHVQAYLLEALAAVQHLAEPQQPAELTAVSA